MTSIPTIVVTVAGAGLVLLAVRDIFHTLWHPGGFGTLARTAFHTTWRVSHLRWTPRGLLAVTGPLGLLAVVSLWTSLIVLGWALIYWPHMTGGFNLSSSLTPADSSDLVRAAYVSLVTLTTVGFGDVVPETWWLRFAVPLEGLLGFLLLTAAISWILQVYPALIRRRTFASRLSLIERSGAVEVARSGEVSVATSLLDSVAEGLTRVRVDLVQYAETYYFRDGDDRQSLAARLPVVFDLIEAGRAHPAAAVRIATAALTEALEDLGELLATSYVGPQPSTREVVEAFVDDHR